MNDAADPIEVALVVTRALDTVGVAHTIGGSIASSVAGEPRSTIDIDIVAAVEERHVAALVAALSSDFYIDKEALLRAVRKRSAANLIHHNTSVKIDLFVAGGTPRLDREYLHRNAPVLDVSDLLERALRAN